jgi:hypothetical protein
MEAAIDMLENVRQWTADWYGPYTADAQANPAGSLNGDGQ